jgi:hypothetical protein
MVLLLIALLPHIYIYIYSYVLLILIYIPKQKEINSSQSSSFFENRDIKQFSPICLFTYMIIIISEFMISAFNSDQMSLVIEEKVR